MNIVIDEFHRKMKAYVKSIVRIT